MAVCRCPKNCRWPRTDGCTSAAACPIGGTGDRNAALAGALLCIAGTRADPSGAAVQPTCGGGAHSTALRHMDLRGARNSRSLSISVQRWRGLGAGIRPDRSAGTPVNRFGNAGLAGPAAPARSGQFSRQRSHQGQQVLVQALGLGRQQAGV